MSDQISRYLAHSIQQIKLNITVSQKYQSILLDNHGIETLNFCFTANLQMRTHLPNFCSRLKDFSVSVNLVIELPDGLPSKLHS
jgi:hypothetical protein